MEVDVKQAQRRTLHFDHLREVLADAEAVTAGEFMTTGNWSAAQILYHVAYLMDVMNHGKPMPLPWPVKLVGRGLRVMGVHRKPYKPGVKPPAKVVAMFSAPPDTTLPEALDYLRQQIADAESETGLKHPSPLFGPMSRADAVAMHCRHAELHFSFIVPQ